MDVKEAVALAKKYIAELFTAESVVNLGLEEVEFDDRSGEWLITVGFSRPWDSQNDVFSVTRSVPPKRSYKLVRISDADKRVLSVKNREPATA